MAKSMMTIRVNPSLDQKMEALRQGVLGTTRKVFQEMASDAVRMTPVDTGAAVTSFSYKANRSSGRSRTSRNKPRRQDVAAMRKIGYDQLMADLAAIDFRSVKSVSLSNGAPHWRYFKSNGMTGRKIFEILAAKYRNKAYRALNP